MVNGGNVCLLLKIGEVSGPTGEKSCEGLRWSFVSDFQKDNGLN